MLVKPEWLGYHGEKTNVKPFSSDTGTLRTDGRTDIIAKFFISISRELKTWQGENEEYSWKVNAIWWNIKTNLQQLADICGYELPTNLQNFTQKDLLKVKILQKVSGGGYFFSEPVVFIGCYSKKLICSKEIAGLSVLAWNVPTLAVSVNKEINQNWWFTFHQHKFSEALFKSRV